MHNILHFHFLNTNILSTLPTFMVLHLLNMSPKVCFNMLMCKMKDECQEVANGLIEELEKLFLEHEINIVLGVIYTWYWVTNPKEVEDKFVFFTWVC